MKISLLIATLLLSLTICAQIRAVTDQGKEVILYENGKWTYASDSSDISTLDSILTNHGKFSKPDDAAFLVKSKRLNIGVAINPNKWTYKSAEESSTASEYMFTMKTTEGFAMLISEKTSIDLESLRAVALINAKKASPDIKEMFSEYRYVNGIKVLYLELRATVNGIKFSYVGYYYTNANGTVQLVAFTTQSAFQTVKPKLLELLNGLTEIKE